MLVMGLGKGQPRRASLCRQSQPVLGEEGWWGRRGGAGGAGGTLLSPARMEERRERLPGPWP